MSSDFMKCGASATTGSSSPLNRTCTAPAFTPALSSTSLRRTPVHSAWPIAPFAHSPPDTRGWKNPCELPEHWCTAASWGHDGCGAQQASSCDDLMKRTAVAHRLLPKRYAAHPGSEASIATPSDLFN